MKTQKYVFWQDEEMFIGYLEAYPDYWTQGETVEALRTFLTSAQNSKMTQFRVLESLAYKIL